MNRNSDKRVTRNITNHVCDFNNGPSSKTKRQNVSTKGGVVTASTESKVTHSTPTNCQRTDAILRGLDVLLEQHGCSTLIRAELSNQLHAVLDSSSTEKVWLDRAKYALTYPLAKFLKNPLPPAPDKAFKPTGKLRGWIKARLNALNRKNIHLWYSWLQVKRCSLPASTEIISATYEKHLTTLTKRDECTDEDIDSILGMPVFLRLLEKIKEDVCEKMSKSKKFTEFAASGSACFEKSRRHNGQQGRLMMTSMCDMSLPFKSKDGEWGHEHFRDSDITTTELWTMKALPKVIVNGVVRTNVVQETRATSGWEDWDSLRGIQLQQQTFFSSFRRLDCTIQGILEPMKVRVISKGNALPYYFCKPLQKAMHSSMRKLDCFRLIGRPFCPTDMIDLAKRAEPTDQWFSVDYSAATDNLSWRYAGRIFNKIIEGLPYETQLIAKSVLGPHNLHYPVEGRKGVEFKGVMQNGQLMGSILSFPILCLANLGVYLKVTSESQKGWSDRDRLRHVLVNGDDMVYAANRSLWEVHEKTAASVGLDMSVGKAYVHPGYANINSTSVYFDLRKTYRDDGSGFNTIERTNESPWLIDYLNTGLFFGQHKVQSTGDGTACSLLEPEAQWDYLRSHSENADSYKTLNPEDWIRDNSEAEGVSEEFFLGSTIFEKSDRAKVLDGETPRFWNTSLFGEGPQAFEKFSKLLKKASINDLEGYENLVSSLNWILKGALPGRKADLLKKFLHVHKENLKMECLGIRREGNQLKLFTRNLFLPIALGGWGVEVPLGFKTLISPVQRAVAEKNMQQLSLDGLLPLSSQYPLPGYEINDYETQESVPWRRLIADTKVYDTICKNSSSLNRKFPILSFQAIPYADNPSYYLIK